MNITHLKYAAEVSRTGSISQAAENLFMSQPNLSKAIKEFELSLGFTIFKRTSKGIEPTAKGADFLAYAENILTQIEEMERRYRSDGDTRSEFSIAVPRASYITHAFTCFLNEIDVGDKLDFNFEETNSMAAVNSVVSGDRDIAIIRCRLDTKEYFYRLLQDKGLSHKRIFTYEYRLLISKQHPLANDEVVDYDKLRNYIEIVHGDLTVPFLTANQETPGPDIAKKVYVYERGSQFDLLRKVPNTYMWVSPMPKELLRCYGLVQKKCSTSSHKYCDVLIYKRGHHFSENENAFLEKLEEIMDEISR